VPRESRTTYRPGTKGRAFRGATLIRRCRTCVTGGRGSPCVRFADDPWRSALPCIAGALRRSLLGGSAVWFHSPVPFGPEAPGSIRRRRHPGFHQPPGLSADARRVLVPFIARLRDVGGVCGEVMEGVKRAPGSVAPGRGGCSESGHSFTRGTYWQQMPRSTAEVSPGERNGSRCHDLRQKFHPEMDWARKRPSKAPRSGITSTGGISARSGRRSPGARSSGLVLGSGLIVPFSSRSRRDRASQGGSGTDRPGSRPTSARTPRCLRKRDHWTRGRRPARIRCIEPPAGSGSVGTADRSSIARTGGTWSRDGSRRPVNGGRCRTGLAAVRSSSCDSHLGGQGKAPARRSERAHSGVRE
jgi:hypothetical protein